MWRPPSGGLTRIRRAPDHDEAHRRRAWRVDHHRVEGAEQPRRHQQCNPVARARQGRGARLPAQRGRPQPHASPYSHARHSHPRSDALVLRRDHRRHRAGGERPRLRSAAVQLQRRCRQGARRARDAARTSGRRRGAGVGQRLGQHRRTAAAHQTGDDARHDRPRRSPERQVPPRPHRRRARRRARHVAPRRRRPQGDRAHRRSADRAREAARERVARRAEGARDQAARRMDRARRLHGERRLPRDEAPADRAPEVRRGVLRQRSGRDWRDEGDLGSRSARAG